MSREFFIRFQFSHELNGFFSELSSSEFCISFTESEVRLGVKRRGGIPDYRLVRESPEVAYIEVYMQ